MSEEQARKRLKEIEDSLKKFKDDIGHDVPFMYPSSIAALEGMINAYKEVLEQNE